MIPFIESAKDEILAKIDTLKTTIDRLISSSQGSNPNIALGNLSNKIDALKQDVGTKSSQVSVTQLTNTANTLTSKIGSVETKINQTNTTLASMDNSIDIIVATATEGRDYAKGMHNIVSKGVIKRVQSGTIRSCDIWNSLVERSYGSGNLKIDVYTYTANMPFSVQASKCLVICNITQVNYDRLISSHVVGYLSGSSQLTLEFMKSGDFIKEQTNIKKFVVHWQVIEFN